MLRIFCWSCWWWYPLVLGIEHISIWLLESWGYCGIFRLNWLEFWGMESWSRQWCCLTQVVLRKHIHRCYDNDISNILLLQLITCQSDPTKAIEKGIPSAISICSCQGWVRQQHASRGLRGTQSCGNAVWLWLCHELPKFQESTVGCKYNGRKQSINHYFCSTWWTPKTFGHQRLKKLFVAVYILAFVEIIRSHTFTTIYYTMILTV